MLGEPWQALVVLEEPWRALVVLEEVRQACGVAAVMVVGPWPALVVLEPWQALKVGRRRGGRVQLPSLLRTGPLLLLYEPPGIGLRAPEAGVG